jgi:UDPglucose 6-dehydrogenase
MKIGIIGQGFVGNAVYQKFIEKYKVLTYDIDKSRCNSTLEEVVGQCDYIFICLPTPMLSSGACDTSVIRKVLHQVSSLVEGKRTIILKSTVPPITTAELNAIYSNLDICFNPEFLTARNAVEDFKNQEVIILGGEPSVISGVGKIYEVLFPDAEIIYTDARVAEMCKYVINAFLSTKVAFANEIKEFCDTRGIDYKKVIDLVKLDDRIGVSHWDVPGYDGFPGFGGTCFPKDINALICEFKRIQKRAIILEAVWNKNLAIRQDERGNFIP